MQLIVFSNPVNLAGEHELINTLFEEGLMHFHLHKPGLGREAFAAFLQQISPRFYRRIVIHSHYELIGRLNLGGIGLPHPFPESVNKADLKSMFKIARSRNLSVSALLHSIGEAEALEEKYNYVFLSPVFGDLSRQHHEQGFDPVELERFLKVTRLEKPALKTTKVIALGGVDGPRCAQVAAMGFDGFAVTDALWEDFARDGDVAGAVEKFRRLKAGG